MQTDSGGVEAQDSLPDRGGRLTALPRNIVQDQAALFTMPFRMSSRQFRLTLPVIAAGVMLGASDTAFERKYVTSSSTTAKHFKTLSDAGLYSMIGLGGGMYVWGHAVKNERLRETGLLSGEAAINAFLDATLIHTITGRNRPFSSHSGEYFQGGASFPSDHAAISFAIASVIAHEYPGPLTQIFSYGAASAVSAARVVGHQHYLTDVAVGGLMGWYIGRQVYRARSQDAEISPKNWGVFLRSEQDEIAHSALDAASTYVPIGSWIYDAFERMQGMGYAPSAPRLMRPWTRLECARMLEQAVEDGAGEEPALAAVVEGLREELAPEQRVLNGGANQSARVEDVYARFTGISGKALRDTYHFGQTIYNDDGRPYGEGGNGYAGITLRGESGALAFYLRGEYQYASAMPDYSPAVQATLASGDELPYGWNLRRGTTKRFRPIEAYVAMNIPGWQVSLGQQALWHGPDRLSSMSFSNNAEAMPMLRIARTSPLELPWLLKLLGPLHGDFFLARQGGIHYLRLGPDYVFTGRPDKPMDPPPYVWGATFSMKPTENLELGFAHTAIFAGYGRPLNLKTFLHTFSFTGGDQEVEPGKRTMEWNLSYRIPGLRNWLTFYTEAFAYDSPLDRISFERYAFTPGLYLTHVPGVPNLDLRVEGVESNLPGQNYVGYFYANYHYAQGYTNWGQIFGSWVGRMGSGGAAQSNYWFSARNRLTLDFRRMTSDTRLFAGGQMTDVSAKLTWMLPHSLEVSGKMQYERWKFPMLDASAKSNVSTTVELRFYPGRKMALGGQSRAARTESR